MNPLFLLRRDRSVTQHRVAGIAGVSLRTVWRAENDEGTPLLQNVSAILMALHQIKPVSSDELRSVARHCNLPVDRLAVSVGLADELPPAQAEPADQQSRLFDKLRVAIAELGFEAVDKHLNDMLLAAFLRSPQSATRTPSDDRTFAVASPPRQSPLGPNIVEQEYRHYSPAPPPAAPTAPPQSPSKPAPKRRPG